MPHGRRTSQLKHDEVDTHFTYFRIVRRSIIGIGPCIVLQYTHQQVCSIQVVQLLTLVRSTVRDEMGPLPGTVPILISNCRFLQDCVVVEEVSPSRAVGS
jgi:hypothetical protein